MKHCPRCEALNAWQELVKKLVSSLLLEHSNECKKPLAGEKESQKAEFVK